MDEKDDVQDIEMSPETEGHAPSDDVELGEEEALSSSKIKQLRTELRSCTEEKMKALEDLQRAKADFLNSKRRLEEQTQRDRERITSDVVTDFLPLIDSFELALNNDASALEGDAHLKQGIEAMRAQFLSILKTHGITEIDASGEFNPHEHEAVSMQKGDNGESSGTILAVLQRGYRRGDAVLRPAKVITAE